MTDTYLHSIILINVYRSSTRDQVLEMMGVGTAAVVCPIAEILYEGEVIKVPTMQQKNPVFERFYQTLTDIQYGRTSHSWSYPIDPSSFD